MFAVEAKKRQIAELAQNRYVTVKENLPERSDAKQASDEAGDLFNVSGRSVFGKGMSPMGDSCRLLSHYSLKVEQRL